MPLPHPDHHHRPNHNGIRIRKDNHHSPPFLLRAAPNSLPDFLLTALSLLFLFSSPPSSKIPPFSCPFFPRRLPKLPSMSLSPKSPKSPKQPRFPTPQSLSDYLKPRLPSDSFSSWGVKPGTKNLHNLWLEITEGETSLEPDSDSDSSLSLPLRTLHVVSLRILAPEDDLVLVEYEQEMSDGTVRRRERFLSEKMKPGECPDDAAVRAVREELGEGTVVGLVDGSYRMRVEERESVSYPGLPASYVMHVFDARVVEGLPLPGDKEEFWTEEIGEKEVGGEAVKVKRHCWKWVPADSVQARDLRG